MLYAKNDSQRLKDELVELYSKNVELHKLIIDLYKWISKTYGKDTIITMIYRTQEEQEQIYGKGTKKKSPHQFWQAIDIRSRTFTEEEIKGIEDYLNNKYNESNYYKWTAKNHKVGEGAYHFHIQYYKN